MNAFLATDVHLRNREGMDGAMNEVMYEVLNEVVNEEKYE